VTPLVATIDGELYVYLCGRLVLGTLKPYKPSRLVTYSRVDIYVNGVKLTEHR
jgi:hypothetical protein